MQAKMIEIYLTWEMSGPAGPVNENNHIPHQPFRAQINMADQHV